MMNTIPMFKGEYQFLSNFYPAEFVWDGIVWLNSEAAYQAAKSADRSVRLTFSAMANPSAAKRAGKVIERRPNWENIKYDIMHQIVFAKFNQNPDLRDKLIATGDAPLEEGNTWKDTTWGICPPGSGCGKNWLGKILMSVRDELRVERLWTM
jgi:ribA/ribD-fused uncharacterized protein